MFGEQEFNLGSYVTHVLAHHCKAESCEINVCVQNGDFKEISLKDLAVACQCRLINIITYSNFGEGVFVISFCTKHDQVIGY